MIVKRTRLSHLEALAAGLCQDARIRVAASPASWCWMPERRTIFVAAPDLEKKGPTYCAGVLAHEVGHYFISRYHLFRVEFPSEIYLSHVLNGIEDPRVNTWIKRRYPGTTAWFEVLRTEDGNHPVPEWLPSVLRFSIECAREELLGWGSDPCLAARLAERDEEVEPTWLELKLPEAVARALDETRTARQRFASILPPDDLDPRCSAAELEFRYHREVEPNLTVLAPLVLELREQAVQLSVAESLALARRWILPVAEELLRQDVERVAGYLRRDRTRWREARRAAAKRDGAALGRLVQEAFLAPPLLRERPISPRLSELALEALELWLQHANHESLGLARPPMLPADVTGQPAGQQPIIEVPIAAYEESRQQIASQIEVLVREMEDVLRPLRRLQQRGGHASGQRVDLKRALHFAADPRRYRELWCRPTIPQRRDTAFSLLVDLSGSMRGDKARAAVAGTVLLAETLHRLEVPFAINGFQDVLIPFCDFGEGLVPHVIEALDGMPQEVLGCRPGGNNDPLHNDDGPCLLEAAEQLLDYSALERVLIVVSDGVPEGRRSTADDLRHAVTELQSVAQDLKLVGIGLGPATDHVRDFYPESVANVPVDQFAQEIGGLLRRILVGAG